MKEFGLFGVIHSIENWKNIERELNKQKMQGKTIGIEATSRMVKNSAQNINALKRMGLDPRQYPTNFTDLLVEYIIRNKMNVVCLEVRRAGNLMLKNKQKYKELVKNRAQVQEIMRAKKDYKRSYLIRETGFLMRLKKGNPDFVLVGANHIDAFKGVPHKVLMNDQKKAIKLNSRMKRDIRYLHLLRKRRETTKLKKRQLQHRIK